MSDSTNVLFLFFLAKCCFSPFLFEQNWNLQLIFRSFALSSFLLPSCWESLPPCHWFASGLPVEGAFEFCLALTITNLPLKDKHGLELLFLFNSLCFYAESSLLCCSSRWGVGLVSDETAHGWPPVSGPALSVVCCLDSNFGSSRLFLVLLFFCFFFSPSQSSLYLLSWLPRKVCAVCLS